MDRWGDAERGVARFSASEMLKINRCLLRQQHRFSNIRPYGYVLRRLEAIS